MSLLLLFGGGGGPPDLSEPITTPPDPGTGTVTQFPAAVGEWRAALEIAEPPGSTWYDITQFYVGDRYQRGADTYKGKYRASLAKVQLQIDNNQAADLAVNIDILAPWGQDTTDLFGTDVRLGAGLLIRLSMVREVDDVVVEWLPLWTGRVEEWGDAASGRGQLRTHVVDVVDLLADLTNVPTTIESAATNWDEYFTDLLLPAANWQFGVDIYGDTTSAGLPQDLNLVAAINRMDQGTDPLGLVWRTLRSGRMVIHPAPWDTTNTDRYDNPLLDVYPEGLKFTYTPDFTDIEYIADDDQQPFGVIRNVSGILNFFVVTMPDDEVYAIDDPVSTGRYGTRPFQATWILSNPPVVDDLMADRAYAESQALPLRTTVDHEGFWPAMGMIDHLDPVTVVHADSDDGLVVTGTGWVRKIVEERTVRDDGLLNWQSTIQIDLDSTETTPQLLPVENLALVSAFTPGLGGPSGAEFSWTNPTQPDVTPTEVQVRVLERSLIWISTGYPGVGADGVTIGFLSAATPYTFQARLVRRVDGVVTHVSPLRQIKFTTPANILPTPTPGDDPGDTDVIGTPPDDECEDFEIELQENDGDPDAWVTVDSFTGAELTANGDGTFSLTTPIPNSFFNEGSMYRFRSTCDGVTWVNGPEFDPPDDWTDPCTTPPALSTSPYDVAIVYVPQICAPDTIREAVSGIAGVHGDALDTILALIDDPNQRALKAIADPEWSDTPGGIVAYGECPQIAGVTHDKSISCRVNIAQDENCVLFECAAMRLTCTSVAGQWRPGVTVYKVGSTVSLAGATLLDVDTAYTLHASHDYETGDIKLYVDAALDNSVGGTDNVATISALPIWRAGVPPESWITDCAVWDAVVDPASPPPAPDLPTAILALNPIAYYKLDETAGTTATDSSGNGHNGTYSVAGTNITLGGVTGPDSVGYARFGQGSGSRVTIPDHTDFSVNTEPGLTVFALIKADTGIGSADRHLVSKANTDSQFEWAVLFNNQSLGFTVWGPGGHNLQSESAAGLADMRGDWHAVAYSTPNATYNTRPEIFLDDNTPESTTQGTVSNFAPYGNGTAAVNIGWRADSPAGGYMIGGIAHVAIFAGEVDLSTVFAAAASDGWI